MAEAFFQLRAVQTADLQRRCVLKHHGVVSVGVLRQLVDEVEIDDVRAVNADEAARIELGLQAAENLTVQVLLFRRVDGHVDSLGGDPPDVAHIDEADAAALFEREAVEVVGSARWRGV